MPIESDLREAWRYCDWVVDAFNRDLPYDEFVTRQMAEVLLPPTDSTRIDAEALRGTQRGGYFASRLKIRASRVIRRPAETA